jgi:hypothetical protein
MEWAERLWKRIFKDVLLTGLGIFAIWRGIQPPGNAAAIGAGLVLTAPSAAEHLKALLPSSGDSHTLPPSPSPGEPGSVPSSSGGPSGE